MVLTTISSTRHIHFNIETIQYLYTGVKGNTFHVDLFFFYLGLDDWKKQTQGVGPLVAASFDVLTGCLVQRDKTPFSRR